MREKLITWHVNAVRSLKSVAERDFNGTSFLQLICVAASPSAPNLLLLLLLPLDRRLPHKVNVAEEER
jgi:hypothetical protein